SVHVALIAAPAILDYQARLTDTAGHPLTGAQVITFTLWDAQMGGNQLGGFLDTDIVTADSHGVCSTDIGDDPSNPIPAVVFELPQLYLNVNVGGTDVSPRER